MPSPTSPPSRTAPAHPQWQVIFFLAHLSHTDVFPNVNRTALANAKAAAIARGINLSEEQIDGLVRRFLNLSRSEKVALRSMDVGMIGPRQKPDTTGPARSNYTWTRNAAGEEIITITIRPNRLPTAPTPIRPRTRLDADIDRFFEQWKIDHPADFPVRGLVQPQQPQPSPPLLSDLTTFLEGASGSSSATTTTTATAAVDFPQPSSASPWLAWAPPPPPQQHQQTDPFSQRANVPLQPALPPSPVVVGPLPPDDFFDDASTADELLAMDAETEAIINNPYHTLEDNMAFLDTSAALASDNGSGGGSSTSTSRSVTATQPTDDGLMTPPLSPLLW